MSDTFAPNSSGASGGWSALGDDMGRAVERLQLNFGDTECFGPGYGGFAETLRGLSAAVEALAQLFRGLEAGKEAESFASWDPGYVRGLLAPVSAGGEALAADEAVRVLLGRRLEARDKLADVQERLEQLAAAGDQPVAGGSRAPLPLTRAGLEALEEAARGAIAAAEWSLRAHGVDLEVLDQRRVRPGLSGGGRRKVVAGQGGQEPAVRSAPGASSSSGSVPAVASPAVDEPSTGQSAAAPRSRRVRNRAAAGTAAAAAVPEVGRLSVEEQAALRAVAGLPEERRREAGERGSDELGAQIVRVLTAARSGAPQSDAAPGAGAVPLPAEQLAAGAAFLARNPGVAAQTSVATGLLRVLVDHPDVLVSLAGQSDVAELLVRYPALVPAMQRFGTLRELVTGDGPVTYPLARLWADVRDDASGATGHGLDLLLGDEIMHILENAPEELQRNLEQLRMVGDFGGDWDRVTVVELSSPVRRLARGSQVFAQALARHPGVEGTLMLSHAMLHALRHLNDFDPEAMPGAEELDALIKVPAAVKGSAVAPRSKAMAMEAYPGAAWTVITAPGMLGLYLKQRDPETVLRLLAGAPLLREVLPLRPEVSRALAAQMVLLLAAAGNENLAPALSADPLVLAGLADLPLREQVERVRGVGAPVLPEVPAFAPGAPASEQLRAHPVLGHVMARPEIASLVTEPLAGVFLAYPDLLDHPHEYEVLLTERQHLFPVMERTHAELTWKQAAADTGDAGAATGAGIGVPVDVPVDGTAEDLVRSALQIGLFAPGVMRVLVAQPVLTLPMDGTDDAGADDERQLAESVLALVSDPRLVDAARDSERVAELLRFDRARLARMSEVPEILASLADDERVLGAVNEVWELMDLFEDGDLGIADARAEDGALPHFAVGNLRALRELVGRPARVRALLAQPRLLRILAAIPMIQSAPQHWARLFENRPLLAALGSERGGKLARALFSYDGLSSEALSTPDFLRAVVERPDRYDALLGRADVLRRTIHLAGLQDLTPHGGPTTSLDPLLISTLRKVTDDPAAARALLARGDRAWQRPYLSQHPEAGVGDRLQRVLRVLVEVPGAMERVRANSGFGSVLLGVAGFAETLLARPALGENLMRYSYMAVLLNYPDVSRVVRENGEFYLLFNTSETLRTTLLNDSAYAARVVENPDLARAVESSRKVWEAYRTEPSVRRIFHLVPSVSRVVAEEPEMLHRLRMYRQTLIRLDEQLRTGRESGRVLVAAVFAHEGLRELLSMRPDLVEELVRYPRVLRGLAEPTAAAWPNREAAGTAEADPLWAVSTASAASVGVSRVFGALAEHPGQVGFFLADLDRLRLAALVPGVVGAAVRAPVERLLRDPATLGLLVGNPGLAAAVVAVAGEDLAVVLHARPALVALLGRDASLVGRLVSQPELATALRLLVPLAGDLAQGTPVGEALRRVPSLAVVLAGAGGAARLGVLWRRPGLAGALGQASEGTAVDGRLLAQLLDSTWGLDVLEAHPDVIGLALTSGQLMEGLGSEGFASALGRALTGSPGLASGPVERLLAAVAEVLAAPAPPRRAAFGRAPSGAEAQGADSRTAGAPVGDARAADGVARSGVGAGPVAALLRRISPDLELTVASEPGVLDLLESAEWAPTVLENPDLAVVLAWQSRLARGVTAPQLARDFGFRAFLSGPGASGQGGSGEVEAGRSASGQVSGERRLALHASLDVAEFFADGDLRMEAPFYGLHEAAATWVWNAVASERAAAAAAEAEAARQRLQAFHPRRPDRWVFSGRVIRVGGAARVRRDGDFEEVLLDLAAGPARIREGAVLPNFGLHGHVDAGRRGVSVSYLLAADGMVDLLVYGYAGSRDQATNKYYWFGADGVAHAGPLGLEAAEQHDDLRRSILLVKAAPAERVRLAELPDTELIPDSWLASEVTRELKRLQWDGALPDAAAVAAAETRAREQAGAGWRRLATRQRGELIAQTLRHGAPVRTLGAGSGYEAEVLTPLTLPAAPDLVGSRSEVLARGRDGVVVIVETKVFYRDQQGLLYRYEAGAEANSAPGTSQSITVAIPELIVGVIDDGKGAAGSSTQVGPKRLDLEVALANYADFEGHLDVVRRLGGVAGSLPSVPLELVLRPEDGWELTELAEGALIGPWPIGDEPGAHLHHNIGVPLAGVHGFLAHVRDFTGRGKTQGYLTRDHLTDALAFGDLMADQYSRWRAANPRPGAGAASASARMEEQAVQALRGHAALLYVPMAAVANGNVEERLNKLFAAVLPRTAPAVLLAQLAPSVREFLATHRDVALADFTAMVSDRLPDYDERFRQGKQRLEGSRVPVLDVQPGARRVRDFLLSGLDEFYELPTGLEDMFRMTVLPALDDNGGRTLPLVVLEVRAYGERPANAFTAAAQHRELVRWAGEHYDQVVRMLPRDGQEQAEQRAFDQAAAPTRRDALRRATGLALQSWTPEFPHMFPTDLLAIADLAVGIVARLEADLDRELSYGELAFSLRFLAVNLHPGTRTDVAPSLLRSLLEAPNARLRGDGVVNGGGFLLKFPALARLMGELPGLLDALTKEGSDHSLERLQAVVVAVDDEDGNADAVVRGLEFLLDSGSFLADLATRPEQLGSVLDALRLISDLKGDFGLLAAVMAQRRLFEAVTSSLAFAQALHQVPDALGWLGGSPEFLRGVAHGEHIKGVDDLAGLLADQERLSALARYPRVAFLVGAVPGMARNYLDFRTVAAFFELVADYHELLEVLPQVPDLAERLARDPVLFRTAFQNPDLGSLLAQGQSRADEWVALPVDELYQRLRPGPAAIAAGSSTPAVRNPDLRNDVILELNRVRWSGRRPNLAEVAAIEGRLRAANAGVWERRTSRQQGVAIAQVLMHGAPMGLRGAGSGMEAEFTTPVLVVTDRTLKEIRSQELARHPSGAVVVVETKEFYRDGAGRLFRNRADAVAAAGASDSVQAVDWAIPELIVGVMANVHGEGARLDPDQAFRLYAEVEARLDGLARRVKAGAKPTVPFAKVYRPESGWVLTDLARGALIGPRPLGDDDGAHVHHNVGVPLAGVHSFLSHVRDHTWRDQNAGYLTRDHLTDALGFGNAVADAYIHWRELNPSVWHGVSVLGATRLEADAVAALRGHAALLYTTMAAVANGKLDKRLSKAFAAVLPRVDPAVVLAQLPFHIRQFLQKNSDFVLGQFEAVLRRRMPGFPARSKVLNFTGVHRRIRDFLLNGLDEFYELPAGLANMFPMTVFPALDDNGGRTLPLLVLEVRSYGERHPTAQRAAAEHRRLTAVAARLYESAVAVSPAVAGSVPGATATSAGGVGRARPPATRRDVMRKRAREQVGGLTEVLTDDRSSALLAQGVGAVRVAQAIEKELGRELSGREVLIVIRVLVCNQIATYGEALPLVRALIAAPSVIERGEPVIEGGSLLLRYPELVGLMDAHRALLLELTRDHSPHTLASVWQRIQDEEEEALEAERVAKAAGTAKTVDDPYEAEMGTVAAGLEFLLEAGTSLTQLADQPEKLAQALDNLPLIARLEGDFAILDVVLDHPALIEAATRSEAVAWVLLNVPDAAARLRCSDVLLREFRGNVDFDELGDLLDSQRWLSALEAEPGAARFVSVAPGMIRRYLEFDSPEDFLGLVNASPELLKALPRLPGLVARLATDVTLLRAAFENPELGPLLKVKARRRQAADWAALSDEELLKKLQARSSGSPEPSEPAPAPASEPAPAPASEPAPAGAGPDVRLFDDVVRSLHELNWTRDVLTQPLLAEAEARARRIVGDTWSRLNTRQRGDLVAQTIADGAPTRLRAGGSGVEGEFTTPIRLYLQDEAEPPTGAELAHGPEGAVLVLETKHFYLDARGRYYRNQDEAVRNGGESDGDGEVVYIPELVIGVMANQHGEQGGSRVDLGRALAVYAAVERALDRVTGEPGEPGWLLADVLGEGWELTPLARGALIGPRPIGDNLGAHVHHTVGVPLAGMHAFLGHVLRHTWRNRSYEYLTQEHLADALAFGDEVAARYIGWRVTGAVPADRGPAMRLVGAGHRPGQTSGPQAWTASSSREVQELRGHAALLYVNTAALVNTHVDGKFYKAFAAVLPRVDPDVMLGELAPGVIEFLSAHSGVLWQRFEETVRARIPGFDALASDFDDLPQGERVDMATLMWHDQSIRDFMLSGLDEAHEGMVAMSDMFATRVLPSLDDNDGTMVPMVVLEVRSYGARHVDAETTEALHRQLVGEAVRAYRATTDLIAAQNQAGQSQAMAEAYHQAVELLAAEAQVGLLHEVARELRRLEQDTGWLTPQSMAPAEQAAREYVGPSWQRLTTRQRGEAIAQTIVYGAPVSVRGSGSGLEVEYPVPMTLRVALDADLDRYDGQILARGPHGSVVVLEVGSFYRGADRRLYRDQASAVATGGGRQVKMAIPELVLGVMANQDGEQGSSRRVSPDDVFALYAAIEEKLDALAGGSGSNPAVPLEDVFPPEDGWALTRIGQGAKVAPRAIGYNSGAYVHYSVGVPFAGVYPFLRHVLAHTWRDRAHGDYLTREHLSDALAFADEIAARYIGWSATGLVPADSAPAHRLVPPVLPVIQAGPVGPAAAGGQSAASGWNAWASREVMQLRGHAAVLYVATAALINGAMDSRLDKAFAAVLPRHDPRVMLDQLSDPVVEFLEESAHALWELFESTLRTRVPDFDARVRALHELPADVPVDFSTMAQGGRLIRDFLISGLNSEFERPVATRTMFETTVLPALDDNGGSTLPLLVLEVRSYGEQRETTVARTEALHRQLTDEAVDQYHWVQSLPEAEDWRASSRAYGFAVRAAEAQAQAQAQPETPAPTAGAQDERQHLLAEVGRELGRLNWRGSRPTDVWVPPIEEQARDYVGAGWRRLTLRQRGEAIAQTIVDGRPAGTRGAGSGIEVEYGNVITLYGDHGAEPPLGAVLARGPEGAEIVVEIKEFYFDARGGRHRSQADAVANGGEKGDSLRVIVPELIIGVMANQRGEQGSSRLVDLSWAMAVYAATERALDSVTGTSGDPDERGRPLEEVLLPQDGWELTELGRGALIRPRPTGDSLGAHVHHSVGVPLAGTHPFLAHVRDHTWRDQSYDYLTRDHLADALDFADEAAAQYIGLRATGQVPEDLEPVLRLIRTGGRPDQEPGTGAWRVSADRDVQELRGHLALLYVSTAALVNGRADGRLYKAFAAVLPRVDPHLLLGQLSSDVAEFLKDQSDALWQRFEEMVRARITGLDDGIRETKGLADDAPVKLSLLAWRSRLISDFMLSGLVPDYEYLTRMGDMYETTLLPALDDNEGRTLPLVVLEVRSYGGRLVTAEESEALHRQLVGEAVHWHERVGAFTREDDQERITQAYDRAVREWVGVPGWELPAPGGGAAADAGSDDGFEDLAAGAGATGAGFGVNPAGVDRLVAWLSPEKVKGGLDLVDAESEEMDRPAETAPNTGTELDTESEPVAGAGSAAAPVAGLWTPLSPPVQVGPPSERQKALAGNEAPVYARAYEAQRFRRPDGENVTRLLLRLYLASDQDPAQLAELRGRAHTGVDQAFNNGVRLPNGDLLQVQVEFVEREDEAHTVVRVVAQRIREDALTWSVLTRAMVIAHEIGHLLGLRDEYREALIRAVRSVYIDGGMMGTSAADRVGILAVDNHYKLRQGTMLRVRPVPPRNLRELGAAVEAGVGTTRVRSADGTAFASETAAPPRADGLPARPSFSLEVRREMLFGTPGVRTGRLRPFGVASADKGSVPKSDRNANGTYRVADLGVQEAGTQRQDAERTLTQPLTGLLAGDLHAGPAGARLLPSTPPTVTAFPAHWSADDAVYAAEQSYLDALRRDGVGLDALRRDAVVPVPGQAEVYRWTGVYAGVRVTGVVRAGEFVSFEPTADQVGLEPAAFLPEPPPVWDGPSVSSRFADMLRFGDRASRTGLHHAVAPSNGTLDWDKIAERYHGVRLTREAPNPNGTYRALALFLDPRVNPAAPAAELSSRWYPHVGGAQMMFPDSWTYDDLLTHILAVYTDGKRHTVDANTSLRFGQSGGVNLELLLHGDRLAAVRPSSQQPHLWPAAAEPVGTGPVQHRAFRLDDVTYGIQTRYVLFPDGGRGVDISVPVFTKVEPGTALEEARIYRERLDAEVARTYGTVGQPTGNPMVRVRIDWVERIEDATAVIRVDAAPVVEAQLPITLRGIFAVGPDVQSMAALAVLAKRPLAAGEWQPARQADGSTADGEALAEALRAADARTAASAARTPFLPFGQGRASIPSPADAMSQLGLLSRIQRLFDGNLRQPEFFVGEPLPAVWNRYDMLAALMKVADDPQQVAAAGTDQETRYRRVAGVALGVSMQGGRINRARVYAVSPAALAPYQVITPARADVTLPATPSFMPSATRAAAIRAAATGGTRAASAAGSARLSAARPAPPLRPGGAADQDVAAVARDTGRVPAKWVLSATPVTVKQQYDLARLLEPVFPEGGAAGLSAVYRGLSDADPVVVARATEVLAEAARKVAREVAREVHKGLPIGLPLGKAEVQMTMAGLDTAAALMLVQYTANTLGQRVRVQLAQGVDLLEICPEET